MESPYPAFNHESCYPKHNLLLLTQTEAVASTMSADSSCSKAVSNIWSKCSCVQLCNLGSKVTSLFIFSYYFKEEYTTNNTYYFAFQKEHETKAQLKQNKFSGSKKISTTVFTAQMRDTVLLNEKIFSLNVTVQRKNWSSPL